MTDTEFIPRIWEFVVHDARFAQIGLRGAVKEVYLTMSGSIPSLETTNRIVRAFWAAWDEYHAQPSRVPIGGGSPNYVRAGELSPWQENAIRAMEDGFET
jgi:hypothetical protein